MAIERNHRAETRAAQGVEATPHLLVRTGETTCALALSAVRRVVRALPVSPLPGARRELLGLAEWSGDPLPILDLAALIGEPPGPRPSFPVTIVLRLGADALGLAADEALEVVNLEVANALGGVSGVGLDGAFGSPSGVIAGEILVGDRPVRLLNLMSLVGDS